jgi:hypothetical protein
VQKLDQGSPYFPSYGRLRSSHDPIELMRQALDDRKTFPGQEANLPDFDLAVFRSSL